MTETAARGALVFKHVVPEVTTKKIRKSAVRMNMTRDDQIGNPGTLSVMSKGQQRIASSPLQFSQLNIKKLKEDLNRLLKSLPFPVVNAHYGLPRQCNHTMTVGFVITLCPKQMDEYEKQNWVADLPRQVKVYNGNELPIYVETFIFEGPKFIDILVHDKVKETMEVDETPLEDTSL